MTLQKSGIIRIVDPMKIGEVVERPFTHDCRPTPEGEVDDQCLISSISPVFTPREFAHPEFVKVPLVDPKKRSPSDATGSSGRYERSLAEMKYALWQRGHSHASSMSALRRRLFSSKPVAVVAEQTVKPKVIRRTMNGKASLRTYAIKVPANNQPTELKVQLTQRLKNDVVVLEVIGTDSTRVTITQKNGSTIIRDSNGKRLERFFMQPDKRYALQLLSKKHTAIAEISFDSVPA